MKKLILTSNGFENLKIGAEFLKIVGKFPQEIKILFIPTASRTNEELYYVEKSREELLSLGIKEENIVNYNLDREISNEELNGFDVIYMCGGNTFYLLSKIKEIKFDEKIKNMVKKGIVYVGVSAGSILAGPNIEISGTDENDIKLKDLTGLNLTDKIISPHYNINKKRIIENFEKENKKKVIRLKDNQAWFIIGDKEFII